MHNMYVMGYEFFHGTYSPIQRRLDVVDAVDEGAVAAYKICHVDVVPCRQQGSVHRDATPKSEYRRRQARHISI